MATAAAGHPLARTAKAAAPFLGFLALLWLLGPALPDPQGSYYAEIVLVCGIVALSAVSLNLVLGLTGQFSMGNAGFMAIGGYTSALVTLRWGAHDASGLVFPLAMLAGGLVAALAGWLVGVPSLRLKGDYLAIVTLGFGEIVRSVVETTPALGAATGLATRASDAPPQTTFFWVFAWLAAAVLFTRRLLQSTHGRALLAVREDEVAAEAMGVDTTGYKVRAFVMSAFFTGISGALFAHYFSSLNATTFNYVRSIEIVTMVVLGGMGSTTGALLAAFGLTFAGYLLKDLETALMSEGFSNVTGSKNIVFSLVLVGTMLLRPKGLLGHWELWQLWDRRRKEPEAAPAAPATPAPAPGDAPLLDAQAVTIRFGGLTAVKSFSLSVKPRELVALIGPNGAGKTTVFNLLTGVYQPTEGAIRVAGRETKGLRPHKIAALGAARTFQNIRLFKELTAFDNVRIACHHRAGQGLLAAVVESAAWQSEEAAISVRARDLLKVMGLSHRARERARNLPYGEQRRLEIARALATGPKVLLLDEPAAGMNAREKVELMSLIRSIRDRFGVAILLIEHDMRLVMGVSERIVVLDHGETIATGTPREIQTDPRVIAAYLGAETAPARAAEA
jgi:branched-chain amino acid transport system permease protein